MRSGKKGFKIGLTMITLVALFMACAPPAFALPTADNVGIPDVSGDQGTYVEVPVTITDVQNGPIISVIFDLVYDINVINVVDVQKGTPNSFWDNPTMNNFAWGTRVSIVYDGQTAHGLQDGSTGSIVLLNVSVIGEPGETTPMTLTNIQFSDTAYKLGTAPVKNGTFTICTSLLEDIIDSFELVSPQFKS